MFDNFQHFLKIQLLFITFVLILEKTSADWPKNCSNGAAHPLIIGNICYLPEQEKLDFKVAYNFCEQNGGDLVNIHGDTLQLKLLNTIHVASLRRQNYDMNYYIWFGCFSDKICEKNKIEARIKENDCLAIKAADAETYKIRCSSWYSKQRFLCQYTSASCESKEISISNAEFTDCNTNKLLPYNAEIEIQCQKGYYLKGPSTIRCLKTSKWSEQPSCIRRCPEITTVSNAKVIHASFEIGGKVIYNCDDGYVSMSNPRKSHFEITCNDLGEWVPAIAGCISETKYIVHYIEGIKGQSIFLDCSEDISKSDNDFIWLKDSQIISNPNVSINGTLYLFDLSEQDIGYYFCFWGGKSLIPGKNGFNVQISYEESCIPSSEDVEHQTVKEGQTHLLLCPRNETQKFFTWYKDNDLFFEDGHHILYPDGSLYINTTTFQDRGTYVCQVKELHSTCMTNHTVELTVQPLSETLCGQAVFDEPHPWVVSLWHKDEISPFCYGTLIDYKWVITTANCLLGFNRKRNLDVFVRVGVEKNSKEHQVDIPVELVKSHPQFSKKRHLNDIGLVRLKQSIVFNENVRPICLSETDFSVQAACSEPPLINGTVVGWGHLDKNNYEDHVIKSELFNVVNNTICFGDGHEKHNSMFCAKIMPHIPATFAGDTGSPFEIQRKKKAFLFGIFSWGDRLFSLGDYDFFTKVSPFMPWIKSLLDGRE